ncbi:MAG TPA: nucleotide exchange factor GrpE [Micromonosporaceae bacterium]
MSEPVPPATGEAAGPTSVPTETEVVVGEPVPSAGGVTGSAQVPGDAASAAAPTEVGAGEAAAPDPTAPGPLGAELEALRAALDERTNDLQRVGAEYANYRKRVERDRSLVAEQATAQVAAALLPVLDDLDRAREHGDLTGPSAVMAEQLNATLAKFGLSGFGEVGDAFDPARHEAVTHQTSSEVTVPTCVTVMRRGYLLGDRLLRPALVAVADPESQ